MTRFRLIAVDFLLMTLAFWVVNGAKRGTLALPEGYGLLLGLFYGAWVVSGVMGKKFVPGEYAGGREGARTLVKSALYLGFTIAFLVVMFGMVRYSRVQVFATCGLLLMAVTGVMVYGLRLFHYSRAQGFGTVALLMVLETVALGLYFSVRKDRKKEGDIESVDQVRQALAQERYDLNVDIETVRKRLMRPAIYKLQRSFQPDEQAFLEFLGQHVDLTDILYVETQVERSATFFALHDDYLMLRLYIGLCKLNDCRRLNVHFLSLHRMLLPGGYFAGYAHTIRTHYDWIYSRFPRPMAHGVYALDFLVHRVAPKLPWVKKVYFAVTKGRNRVISRTEVLGRLSFCGFEIIATKVIDNRFYFIVRKVKTPSADTSPTYGPLVALKRSGLGGRAVHTYKFRTMYALYERTLKGFNFKVL